jgi:hypothetical protein
MKGIIEVRYSSGKKRIAIAVNAIISVRERTDNEADITLTEFSLSGDSVTLHVNHTYAEVLGLMENAS